MNVTCNGCDKTIPFTDMLTHDATCTTHQRRGPGGWTSCTHPQDRCYRAEEAQ